MVGLELNAIVIMLGLCRYFGFEVSCGMVRYSVTAKNSHCSQYFSNGEL